MKKFVLKNGSLIDKNNHFLYTKSDILVENGVIQEIGPNLNPDCETVDAEGLLVSPGMIDVHVHTQISEEHKVEPDILGCRRGATAIIECGTVPADSVAGYAGIAEKAETRCFALLGAHSDHGMVRKDQIDVGSIHEEVFRRAVREYPDLIVGLKCACSGSYTGEKGYDVVKKAKEMARELHLPTTVHIGRFPPDPGTLAPLLESGDVITHTFHGKEISVFENGSPKKPFAQARERGVLFDVGHGRESFSWEVCKRALDHGFFPDLIGTDIYYANMDGPVRSLAVVMSKLISLGMTLEDAVSCVTSKAAKTYHLKNLGQLRVGCLADFTLFTLEDGPFTINDSYGNPQKLSKVISPRKVVISKGGKSKVFECDQGHLKAEN
ncbi:amidohydrolase family protein [Caproiciproducens sp.]